MFSRRLSLILALLLLGAVSQAQAFYPASGFYWNPAIPGRGYAIEIQDDQVFITVYTYDAVGLPLWFTAQGQLTGDDRFEGSLDLTENGPCANCGPSSPVTTPGFGGPFVLDFLNVEQARLQWDGGVELLERFNFALGGTLDRMLGEWSFLLDFSSDRGDEFPYDGDVLVFDRITGPAGDRSFDGCRPDDSQSAFCSAFALDNHDAAGLFDSVAGEYVIVVADTPGFFLAYFLDVGLNRATGVAQVYAEGAEPSGPEYPVRGYRSASRAFVQTGVGPAKSVPGEGARLGLVDRRPELLSRSATADPRRRLLVARLIESLGQRQD